MKPTMGAAAGERAVFRTVTAHGVEEVSEDVAALDDGFHVVVMTFEGQLTAVRMRQVHRHEDEPWAGARFLPAAAEEPGESASLWRSSLGREAYTAGVDRVREHIADGTVYQVNLCRVLERGGGVDMDRLFLDVLAGNPAPYASRIDVDGVLDVVSASPELFLERDGARIASSPIKGTAPTLAGMLDKDATENIMITDLVRNDLQRVCEPGTVEVDGLLAPQEHPGLVHLVSTVRGVLQEGATWPGILEATFPPGSVSGAPKSSALEVIRSLETRPRGPYCGAVGWVDADSGTAELAVGIRTFWSEKERNEMDSRPIMSTGLCFGTGAGITWDSDPAGEWEETELKARRLVGLADSQRPWER